MNVEIDGKAIKDLSKLEELERYPHIPNLKKLTNFDPPYRLRVGNYRVLFNIEDNTITVYRVRHRKESYK